MSNWQHVHNIAEVENLVQQQHQSYKRNVEKVQNLLGDIKEKLDQAKDNLRSTVRSQNHIVQSDLEVELQGQQGGHTPREYTAITP